MEWGSSVLHEVTTRIVPAALFVAAGVSKWIHFQWFASGLAEYRVVPAGAVKGVAGLVVALEIAAGMTLLMGLFSPWSSYVVAALLSLFVGVLAQALLRGQTHHTCNCMKGATDTHIGWRQVIRNVSLIVLTLLYLAEPVVPRLTSTTLIVFAVFVATVVLDAFASRAPAERAAV